jgi:hypothetical protein
VPGIALQLQEFVVYVMKRAAHSAILLLKLISFVVKSSKLNGQPRPNDHTHHFLVHSVDLKIVTVTVLCRTPSNDVYPSFRATSFHS